MVTFLNIVWQCKRLKMWPHCAHHSKYTLPCLLEVYQKPQIYEYLGHTVYSGPNGVGLRFRGAPLYMYVKVAGK